MDKLLTEAIGTFVLVLTVGLAVLAETPFAGLAIGCSLMIMVYMGGHISGAHYNPAVTLAVLLRRGMPSRDAVPYWIAQIVGAILAALAVWAIFGTPVTVAPADDASVVAALLVEVLYTFALALVVLHTATAPATSGNSYFGLAIGFTLVAGIYAGGSISGGAFNPAVGIGPIVVDALGGGGTFAHLWLYLVGPLLGGALAALSFALQGAAEPKA